MKIHITRREKQVIDGVASGLSKMEIARRLGITERTVYSHLFDCQHKLSGKPYIPPQRKIKLKHILFIAILFVLAFVWGYWAGIKYGKFEITQEICAAEPAAANCHAQGPVWLWEAK